MEFIWAEKISDGPHTWREVRAGLSRCAEIGELGAALRGSMESNRGEE